MAEVDGSDVRRHHVDGGSRTALLLLAVGILHTALLLHRLPL